jgi:hypothetical protein
MERKSEAVEPGKAVGVGPGSTTILDGDDADLGVKFYISNGSDADIRIRYGASAMPGSGILLKPGNTLEEDRYAGEVSGVPETPGVVKFVGVTIV